VTTLLSDSRHAGRTIPGLVESLAQLAQQVGWMAYDADRHGMAQRYYLAGLRLAHDSRDRSVAAHVLADIAYQSASRDDAEDAVVIGEAALHVGQRAPAGVYASLQTRAAYAYAMAGRLHDFERNCWEARESLMKRRIQDDPDWMYYMTSSHIDGLAGIALVQVGRRHILAGGLTKGRKLLSEAEGLLDRARLRGHTLNRPNRRRALFEDAWLALARSGQENLQGACDTARLALRQLEDVSSPRSVVVLRALARDLRKRSREWHVKELLPELDEALGR
jgi:hypothetical protein